MRSVLILYLLAVSVVSHARTVVIGFDGMDPKLVGNWMAEGILPNFQRLAEDGYFQMLDTTNPAQSPVAWASFATGQNPGAHGIFDFIRRDVATYAPDFSISELTPPEDHIDLFGYHIPLDEAVIRNRRVGKPFWISAEQRGKTSTVLRVPVTYPPDRVHRMLSGMGVPDLIGSQGTFTIYNSRFTEHHSNGGRVVRVKPRQGRIETTFEGPQHPLAPDRGVLSVPLIIADAGNNQAEITLDATKLVLSKGQWSDWIEVSFPFAGVMSTQGMVRLNLVEAFPRPSLYVSPINIDPRDPAIVISSPEEYAGELAARIGPYHTLGMPEETWSLNEHRIDDDAYLDMVQTVLKEREAMFFDSLERNDSELIVAVFVQTDRVSHMFWRGLDRKHPLHDSTSERGKQAIRWIYSEADRILGLTMEGMAEHDRLIVLSDHGFSDFRRAVHVNRWLIDEGYLRLKPGAREVGVAFANVDWVKSRAYALGLNGLFLNLKDREAQGVVAASDSESLKQEIRDRLLKFRDPDSGERVVDAVFDAQEIYEGTETENAPDLVIGYRAGFRASWQTVLGAAPPGVMEDNREKWSGDHCITPSRVPGVLFTSFKPELPVNSIQDIARLVLSGLPGAATPADWNDSAKPGIFDYGNPLFDRIRSGITWLPRFLQIMLWSLLGAFVSMRLYAMLSGQDRLRALKSRLIAARRELASYDGPFGGLWPLIGENYRLAATQLWLTFLPALLSSLPLLFLLAWISNAYDARLPERGEPVEVRLHAAAGFSIPETRWVGVNQTQSLGRGHWRVIWPDPERALELREHDDTLLLRLPLNAAVDTIHQRLWWNRLFANPGGYLPAPGVIERIDLDLPRIDILGFGPQWMRAWYFSFFLGLLGFSLLFKYRWKLH